MHTDRPSLSGDVSITLHRTIKVHQMDKIGISRSSLQFQYAYIKRATLERLDMLKT